MATWEPEDSYRKSWNRQHRGLLIFLLDQSGSMRQPVQIGNRQYTNGEMATLALNDLIVSVINNTPIDSQTGRLKDYCDLLVLGYGNQVTPLLDNRQGAPVSIKDLAENPIGRRPVLVEKYDRVQGKKVQVQEMQPFWINYTADSTKTEMAKALQRAYRVVQDWLQADLRRRQSFPPIVINITDGAHNGEGDPIEAAKSIRRLYTDDGHVLLFSCHLTSNSTSHLVFPRDAQMISRNVSNADEREWAVNLFEMSSEIPATMAKRARESFNAGLPDGARGFIYNANPADLIDFLSWGTRPSQNFER
jgi:uncharacterized protein YegL